MELNLPKPFSSKICHSHFVSEKRKKRQYWQRYDWYG